MFVIISDVLKTAPDIEQKVFGVDTEILVAGKTHSNQISDENWKKCDAILAWDQIEYDATLLEKMRNCKVIVRVGVGYDNINSLKARELGIKVCNVPDYGTEEVADHAIGMLLSLARGLPDYINRARNGDWSRTHEMPFRLRGLTMGFIGVGRIGTATLMRARAFGMNIVFYDPYVNDGYEKALGVDRVDTLEDLAKIADIVSINTPLSEETNKMIGRKFFSVLKPGAIVINTARGPIIDLEALKEAMLNNIVRAAGLDVLPVEPSDDSQTLIRAWEKSEPWIKDRLIVTPHVAFYSPESYEEMRRKAAEEALRVVLGEQARNCVN